MAYKFYTWMDEVFWKIIGDAIIIQKTSRDKYGNERLQSRRHTPCICKCGFEKLVSSSPDGALETSKCNRCKEGAGHGHWVNGKPSRTWKSWDSMRQRCYNPNAPNYDLYGGLGVIICKKWRTSFEAFLADMGERPPNTSLDRYPDCNGIYAPSNCRWATPKQQTRNRKKTKMVLFKGESRMLVELTDEFKMNYDAVYARLRIGWDIERALSTPIKSQFRPKSVKSI